MLELFLITTQICLIGIACATFLFVAQLYLREQTPTRASSRIWGSDRHTYHVLPEHLYGKILGPMSRKGKCIPIRVNRVGGYVQVVFEQAAA